MSHEENEDQGCPIPDLTVEAIDLFPIPVSKYNFENELDWKAITSKALALEYEPNGYNWRSVDTSVLELPEFKGVKDLIFTALEDYAKAHVSLKQKFRITISWCNVNDKNESHHAPHTHSNSFISGVVYLNTNYEDYVEFQRPAFTLAFPVFDFEDDPMAGSMYAVPVKTGDIMLFPSNVPHAVNPHNRPEKRVSLAFNVWPVGKVGSKYGLNYLDLDLS